MQTLLTTYPALSLLPPLLALGMALITRKVILSLAGGIILGALLVNNFVPGETAQYIFDTALALVWESAEYDAAGNLLEAGGLELWNVEIIIFLLVLGAMTSIMTLSGATHAFAEKAKQRLTKRRDATLLTALLSFVVFVDDYFHSLAVGSVTRPVTDQFKVSRAKLAYLLDSTAAPMCVLMPLSSWGAYIIALVGGLLVTHGMTEMAPLTAFVAMIPFNFYALFALMLALAVAYFNINLGSMKVHEERAQTQGLLFDPAKPEPAGASAEFEESANGQAMGLILPILVLILSTFACFVITGHMASEPEAGFSILASLENTDVTRSLVIGAVLATVVALGFTITQGESAGRIGHATLLGAKSMLPAILILLFAWGIGSVIGDLETGKFLATMVEDTLSPSLLPLLVFILAGIMAFSTGTSWGTFGIMLPIAADMAAGTDISLMLPMLSAVLAGAVFGDHASPISDTSILSSTGAACDHMDHVNTQLPYALLAGGISVVSYLVYGFTGSVILALGLGLAILAALVIKGCQNAPVAQNA
ncbi:Na+/H+ antiporter NhaC family protein [Aliagarivorans taiwanensis]|uniref:Na+/H+ antiporter NhaC family protein n=1 Tax=Aliagarivorans taiwanensis TaxID=561966 RepID=UPI0003FA66D1|nr:Na+/H+ antiporter NhaC family protein [Aliagarivorans taiwanensis]